MWSWPSRADGHGVSYFYDKESADGVAVVRFEELLTALQQDAGTSSSLDILAHSMGGQHTTETVERMSSHGSPPRLRNLVFAAPDIPTDEFRFALNHIQRSADRVTLYACGWDWALSLSQSLHQYPRADTGGRNIFVDSSLESINVGANLFSANHSYVFDPGLVLQDLKRLLLEDIGAMDRGLLRRPKESGYYWEWP